MRHNQHLALLACLAVAPLMVACGGDPAAVAPETTAGAPATALGRTVDRAMAEAREKIATENISIGGDTDIHVGGTKLRSRHPVDADGNPLPKAEISPAGDFLVEGREVAITPEQRALLLDYRGHVVAVIEAGMALGVKGADLGMQAAGDALKSVFSGRAEEFGQRMEAEAAKIEAEALKLCDGLPAMLETQRQLAASLPEFRPYATMEAEDVEECRDSGRSHAAAGAELQAGAP